MTKGANYLISFQRGFAFCSLTTIILPPRSSYLNESLLSSRKHLTSPLLLPIHKVTRPSKWSPKRRKKRVCFLRLQPKDSDSVILEATCPLPLCLNMVYIYISLKLTNLMSFSFWIHRTWLAFTGDPLPDGPRNLCWNEIETLPSWSQFHWQLLLRQRCCSSVPVSEEVQIQIEMAAHVSFSFCIACWAKQGHVLLLKKTHFVNSSLISTSLGT